MVKRRRSALRLGFQMVSHGLQTTGLCTLRTAYLTASMHSITILDAVRSQTAGCLRLRLIAAVLTALPLTSRAIFGMRDLAAAVSSAIGPMAARIASSICRYPILRAAFLGGLI